MGRKHRPCDRSRRSGDEGILAGVQASAETKILLVALRAYLGTAGTPDLDTAVASAPDWDEVLALAGQHAVTPLLHQSLSILPDGVVPAEVTDELRRRAEDIALRNLELTGELIRILDRLEAAGIEALPYKGPSLAAVAYGDTALREFVDLDILVDPSKIDEALALLGHDGYGSLHPLTPKQDRNSRRNSHDRQLVRGRFVIEIQWAICDTTYALPRDTSAFFRRATRLALGGREVPSLAAEDLLLILCVHGSIHMWERLAWVCDVAEVLDHVRPLDVATVRRRAVSAGAERMLLLGVEMARQLLETEVPPELRVRARHRTVTALAQRLGSHLVKARAGDAFSPDGATQFAYRLRMRDTATDRVTEAFRIAVTPSASDVRSVSLPDVLWPLYYPIRIGRLAWAYGFRRRRPGDGFEDAALPD
jgi:hypothetical protein